MLIRNYLKNLQNDKIMWNTATPNWTEQNTYKSHSTLIFLWCYSSSFLRCCTHSADYLHYHSLEIFLILPRCFFSFWFLPLSSSLWNAKVFFIFGKRDKRKDLLCRYYYNFCFFGDFLYKHIYGDIVLFCFRLFECRSREISKHCGIFFSFFGG